MTTTDTTTTPLTLRGAFTALVTPFTPDGALDEAGFTRLVERQLDLGIDGLVPCGTTGESPTTSHEEDDRLIGIAVAAVARRGLTGRVPVIAGTGSNSTATAVAATRRAAAAGADAALVVAPYYNKPDQRMLEAHYRTVADEGGLPVVVYNVPGRTSCNVDASTVLRLAEHPGIIAVKEASANLEQIMTIVRDRPAGFSVLSGDDSWTFALLALGGDGVISVASNEIPAEMTRLCALARDGAWDEARALHERLLELMRTNFISPNPVPVKAALAEMGLIHDVLRQPLLPLADELRPRLRAALASAGVEVAGGTLVAA
ncbi:MAG: 4-hydroxy-tetrahydrodipicolinate synthase [Chloroflexi bacterium]|nr:4-hydroxy-tetrahydrodipicolinate synthase [Chloroflexota bacterium]